MGVWGVWGGSLPWKRVQGVLQADMGPRWPQHWDRQGGCVWGAHADPIPEEPPSLRSPCSWGLVAPWGMQDPGLNMCGAGTSAVWSGCRYTGMLQRGCEKQS